MTQFRIALIGLVLMIGAQPLVAWSAAVFAYVPSLTGNYVVGSRTIPLGGTATFKEEDVLLSWTGGPGPSYLTYELSGVLGDPQAVLDERFEPRLYGDPTKINFNGQLYVSPSPGVSWGTTLNENADWPGIASFQHEYDPTTGQFYVGVSLDVYAAYNDPCCAPWPDTVSFVLANVHAVFYNIESAALVSLLDPGFVFVESARVGLSDLPLNDYRPEMQQIIKYPAHVPEPSTALLMLAAALGLAAARWGRYRGHMIQGEI